MPMWSPCGKTYRMGLVAVNNQCATTVDRIEDTECFAIDVVDFAYAGRLDLLSDLLLVPEHAYALALDGPA